ncbi:hypothetical protein [Roseibium sp. M-1]
MKFLFLLLLCFFTGGSLAAQPLSEEEIHQTAKKLSVLMKQVDTWAPSKFERAMQEGDRIFLLQLGANLMETVANFQKLRAQELKLKASSETPVQTRIGVYRSCVIAASNMAEYVTSLIEAGEEETYYGRYFSIGDSNRCECNAKVNPGYRGVGCRF